VLVSPDGALSYVPFSMVLPDRDVAYVPSGTTYQFLRENEAPPGSGVLAIADPDYRAPRPHDDAATSLRGPSEYSPLPGTRLQAEAIGADRILRGPEATESGLVRALRQHLRWHSVLFGCHGLVDSQHPALSALALTADAQDDGFLTVLDIFRTPIPADLVFLSACKTGLGRNVRGEGIVGLVRAFMYAGSPRVIASLWNVDDDATRVLVTAFYGAWKSGSSAAAALRKAQAVVRESKDHDWSHPTYWAAWVLWGLPD
jgi:CHAT domain-containing protein